MYRVGAVKSSRLRTSFVHWQGTLGTRRDIPLSHPKVLGYLLERVSTFLIPNGLVDMVKEPLSHVASRLNGFIFLSDLGILQDLINQRKWSILALLTYSKYYTPALGVKDIWLFFALDYTIP
jgi:hypothetical protein